MRRGHILLRVTSAILCGTTIVTAFTGFDQNPAFTALDERLWTCCAIGAGVVTLAALQQAMAGKAARLYTAVTKAAVSRPALGTGTGPMAKLVPLQGARPARHARR